MGKGKRGGGTTGLAVLLAPTLVCAGLPFTCGGAPSRRSRLAGLSPSTAGLFGAIIALLPMLGVTRFWLPNEAEECAFESE
jgi:hypothetical protein